MFKLSVFLFVIIFFNACGVDTASSETVIPVEEPIVEEPVIDKTPSDFALIDLNPVNDVNDTIPDDNGTVPPDDNSTIPPDDNSTVVPGDINSSFDTVDAIEDQLGCIIGDINDGYTNNSIKDNSNDYTGQSDEEDGIGITSLYSYNSDITRTEVTVFYYDLKPVRSMDIVSILKDDYIVSIDNAWARNDQTVMYVRTPKDYNDLYGCYRYDLSSINNNDNYTITKVYRVNE